MPNSHANHLPGDDEVLTFSDWCTLNKISKRTGRRILGSGQGPRVTELSQRRIGIERPKTARCSDYRAEAKDTLVCGSCRERFAPDRSRSLSAST